MQIKAKTKEFKRSESRESISNLLRELNIASVDLPMFMKSELFEIATQTEMANPDLIRLYCEILCEMFQVTDFANATFVAELATEWALRRNPYMIDYAMFKCLQWKIFPPPLLAQTVLKTLQQRFNGDERAGTPNAVMKQISQSETLMLMLKLVYVDHSLSLASSKAAYWMRSEFPKQSLLASRLEKLYSDEKKSPGKRGQRSQQDITFKIWDRVITPEQRRHWLEEAEKLPEADDALKGNRHS